MKKLLWAMVVCALLWPAGAYAADSLVVDNTDPGYQEITTWHDWFTSYVGYLDSSRYCVRDTCPMATARWTPPVSTTDNYNVYYYLPWTENASTNAKYVIVHAAGRDSVYKDQNKASGNWVFLGAYDFAGDSSGYVEAVNDTPATGWAFRTDAISLEAVGDTQDIHCVYFYHDFGMVPVDSTSDWTFDISNVGGDDLIVDSITTSTAEFTVTDPTTFPDTLSPGSTMDITVQFHPTAGGTYADSVEIYSNDPDTSEWVRTVDLVGQSGAHLVDDDDAGYSEPIGSWTDSGGGHNGDHRMAVRSTNPMATAQWTPDVAEADTFNVFFWLTHTDNSATNALYVMHHAAGDDSVYRDQNRGTGDYWIFLGQHEFNAGTGGYIQVVNDTNVVSSGYVIRADAIKLEVPSDTSDLYVIDYSHDFGQVTQNTSSDWVFTAHNVGSENLTVDSVVTSDPAFTIPSPTFPQTVLPGQGLDITVRFTPPAQGNYSESLTIYSDDPGEPTRAVLLYGEGVGAQVIVDNEDGAPLYTETGTWGTSGSSAWGANSRYATTPRDTAATATWLAPVSVADYYDVSWIIVNTDWTDQNALYVIHASDGKVDSMRVNQQFCTDWTLLSTYYFDTDTSGYVTLVGDSLCSGPVVRADAIKFLQAKGDTTPPETVDDLAATKSGDDVYLSWTPVNDVYMGVDYYIVFRDTVPSFTPTSGDSIGTTPDTISSYVDSNAVGTPGTNYYYAVQAVDVVGNKSGYSNQVGEFDKNLSNVK